jgi:hypothetical protein
MGTQVLKEHSEVLLKEPAFMEVCSGRFEIYLIGLSKLAAAEPSAQIGSTIRKPLRPLGSSVGDMIMCSHSRGSLCFLTTRHFMYYICLCYGQKIRYILIWHLLSI